VAKFHGYPILHIFLVVQEFELRASCLLSRHSTTVRGSHATSPTLFNMYYFNCLNVISLMKTEGNAKMALINYIH
jgi:hypothetical protein